MRHSATTPMRFGLLVIFLHLQYDLTDGVVNSVTFKEQVDHIETTLLRSFASGLIFGCFGIFDANWPRSVILQYISQSTIYLQVTILTSRRATPGIILALCQSDTTGYREESAPRAGTTPMLRYLNKI